MIFMFYEIKKIMFFFIKNASSIKISKINTNHEAKQIQLEKETFQHKGRVPKTLWYCKTNQKLCVVTKLQK